MPIAVKVSGDLVKTCLECRETKPAIRRKFFYSNPSSRDGLASRCVACVIRKKRAQGVQPAKRGRVPFSYKALPPEIRAKRAALARRWQSENKDQNYSNQFRWRMMITYGITPEQLAQMQEERDNCCDICGVKCITRKIDRGAPDKERGKILQIDHCHETGEVRGLLCLKCNIGLGWFSDDTDRLRAAAEYLENPRLKKRLKMTG